jgi:transcriptional regulator
MDRHSTDLLPGTLDLLILKAISLQPLHGYGVLNRIHQITDQMIAVPQGSLYPALYRLQHQGLIRSTWGESENKRRARYYTLTPTGRTRLRQETAGWERLSAGIGAALKATPDEA